MRVLRTVLALPFFLVGAYLALTSLLVACSNMVSSTSGAFLFFSGLPTSLTELALGAAGMVLIGIGYAIATGGER